MPLCRDKAGSELCGSERLMRGVPVVPLSFQMFAEVVHKYMILISI